MKLSSVEINQTCLLPLINLLPVHCIAPHLDSRLVANPSVVRLPILHLRALLSIRQLISRGPRIQLSRLELQLPLMFLPHPLQYPEIIQEIQQRGDERARRRRAHRDLGGDGESASLLRVDVDERRDQPRYRVEQPDPICRGVG